MTAIWVEGLRKTYKQVRALDGLSFEVASGTVFGFLGPNGAGKTTTLRILAGLARPDSGEAFVAGHPAGPASPARRLVGYLPEEPRFYTWMTATEFLRDYVAGLFGLEAEEARRRTAELLDLVGLQDAARRRIAGFSRGMRQRLGLAQALLNRPQVVLLDEPVSALDPAGRRDMLLMIEELRRTSTVLMSTHILDDVERVCDTVGIIKDGRMVTVDERQALLDRYATPLIEIAFRAQPDRIAAWAEQVRRLPGVASIVTDEACVRIQLGSDLAADQQVLAQAVASGMPVERFEHGRPKLEDVFLRLVGQAKEGGVMVTLLRKELREQWRSNRLLVVVAVLVAMGILGPLTARYMNDILGSIPGTPEGLEAVLPPPTAELAVSELTENLAQFGLILALLVPMAAVVGEKTSGTAALTLSKPVGRGAFLAAKMLTLVVTFGLGISLAVGAGYAYTGMLFEWLPVGGFAQLAGTLLIYLLFYASLTLLASTLMRSQLAAAGLAFGLALVLGIVGTLPAVGALLPSALLAWGRAAASGASIAFPWKALAAASILIPGLLVIGWAALRRQEL